MRLVVVFLPFLAFLAVACGSSGDGVVSPATEVVEEVAVSTSTPVPTPPANTPVPTLTPRPTEPPPPTQDPEPALDALDNWDSAAFQPPAIPTERFDLSQLDAAATEAKLIELLQEGWVMYNRQSALRPRDPLGTGIDAQALLARTPADITRLGYPETIVIDGWTSLDPAGGSISVRFELNTDGDLLNSPVQLADSVARVDMATGIIMEPNLTLKRDRDADEIVSPQFTAIGRNREVDRSEVLAEYRGRPSVIFADTFEYQIANPFWYHQIREQTEDDGSITLLSELHTLDFAMFPPGSMPKIPSWPPN